MTNVQQLDLFSTPPVGKPLTELREEAELGFALYAVPGGYACLFRSCARYGFGDYLFIGYDDLAFATFDEAVEHFEKHGQITMWSTFDMYEGHPPIESVEAALLDVEKIFREVQESE